MDTVLALMDRAAARTVEVVRAIDPTQTGLATPCAEFDVQALYNHLFHVAVNLQLLAQREAADLGAPAPHRPVDAEAFEQETKRLVAAWSGPGALDGTVEALGLPATAVAMMGMTDIVVHGWDLATATGQPYEVDEETAAAVLDFVGQMGPVARQMGVFADTVAVADDAPTFDRTLASTGRDPRWTPAA